MRKRKVTYPPPRTDNKPRSAGGPGPQYGSSVVSIDLDAATGRPGFRIGDRVRIVGTGLYSGEAAVIERFAGGVIPAASVRTEAGRTRQVRMIDLEPIGAGS